MQQAFDSHWLDECGILRWHIEPVTNPTLFGIIKTPAASHSNTSNTCISLSKDTPHAISYASLQKSLISYRRKFCIYRKEFLFFYMSEESMKNVKTCRVPSLGLDLSILSY
jgi:hypothetical protein